MSISSVFSIEPGLVLPGAAASRSYAVTRAEASTNAAEQLAAASSSVASRTPSARFAPRSLAIEDFSALVAEAEVRARTLELFGNRSDGSSATESSRWVAQDEEPRIGDWLLSDSPAASSFTGIEKKTNAADALNSSLLTDPADENADGFVSLTEELAYSRTHSLDSTVFDRQERW